MKFNEIYFSDSTEYPEIGDLNDIMQEGILYCYISHTFLNGFINYVEPLQVYIIDRYHIDSQEPVENENREIVLHVTKERGWETKIVTTKQDAFDILNSDYKVYHTKLGMFDDDVLFLGKTERYYWFFWFDCDVSDCCIGRFQTDESEEEIIKAFTEYCLDKTEDKIYEFKKDWIKGWVSF
jgi:hypothetical protein